MRHCIITAVLDGFTTYQVYWSFENPGLKQILQVRVLHLKPCIDRVILSVYTCIYSYTSILYCYANIYKINLIAQPYQ